MRDRQMRNRVLSLVSLGVMALMGTVFVGAFFFKARKKVDARLYASPRKTLFAIWNVNERFRRHDYDADGKKDYAISLAELQEAECVQDDLVEGPVSGYRYALQADPQHGYVMTATPAEVSSKTLFYWMTPKCEIRAEFGKPAGQESTIYWDRRHKFQWPHERPEGEDGVN